MVALLLAALGTYGVLARLVSQRVPEIGVRMALGADAGSIRAMVLSSALGMIAVGLGIGVVLAVVAARFIERVLYETPTLDPASFAASGITLVVAALLASHFPAARATRTSPVEALRSE